MSKIKAALERFNNSLYNAGEACALAYWRHQVNQAMLSNGFSKKEAAEMAQAADFEFFEIWEDGKREKLSRMRIAAMEGAREYRLDMQSRAAVVDWINHDWVSSRKGTPIEILFITGRGSKSKISFKHANHGAVHTASVAEFCKMAKRI